MRSARAGAVVTAADVAARCQKTRQQGDGWVACCPAHEDRTPSLRIDSGDDGRVLLCCRAGCTFEAILAAMHLEASDLFPDKATTKAQIVATYRYEDAGGAHVFDVCRFSPKEFRQRRADGTWSMKGVRRVLYRLRELQGRTIAYVTEGEKDADRLRAIGLPGTTSPGGAGKWRDAYADQLKAATVEHVVVLPDHDEPGRQHAEQVAASCHAAGLKVKIVTLPGLPAKGDVSDYLDAGHTKAELIALVKAAPLYEPHGTVSTPRSSERDDDEPAQVDAPITAHGSEWPQPLGETAYHGVFGEIVKAIEPHTEADPAALLVQSLVMFGNVAGRTAHFRVEADTHYLNLFAALVGQTSKGRKGVSAGHARHIFRVADQVWLDTCHKSGLSSGEGLIWAVRDAIEKKQQVKEHGRVVDYQTVVEDAGISDKRLLASEPELASTLRVLGREGNTLSALIRQAWDGHDLRVLTKNSPAKATAPHISIIGHITRDELRRYLDATESANGFGNRFLWVCVRRSKLLPDGGGVVDLERYASRVRAAVDHARGVGELRRDTDAGRLWHLEYSRISAGRPGLLGAMTARAEAQTMRLACLYAVGDRSLVVGRAHLRAALELWRYCFDSTAYIFGSSLGDPTADDILRALKASSDGLTRRDLLHDVFGRNKPASEISRALDLLAECHLARHEDDRSGGGRPAERWFACAGYDLNDLNDQTTDPGKGMVVKIVKVVEGQDGASVLSSPVLEAEAVAGAVPTPSAAPSQEAQFGRF